MPRYRQEATEEELQELALLMGELETRGLKLPTDIFSKKLIWPVDSRGYFTKLDGKFFQQREELKNFIDSKARFVALVSGRGGGKALSLDTPIPTITGWKNMGSISVGDIVFDEKGDKCSVLFISPIMYKHDCYEVKFSDGSTIIADAEHE